MPRRLRGRWRTRRLCHIATLLTSRRLALVLGLALTGLLPAAPALADCTAQQVGAYVHTECAGEGYRIRTTTIRVGEYVYSDTSGGALSDPVRVTSRPSESVALAAPEVSGTVDGGLQAVPAPAATTSDLATTSTSTGELLLP